MRIISTVWLIAFTRSWVAVRAWKNHDGRAGGMLSTWRELAIELLYLAGVT